MTSTLKHIGRAAAGAALLVVTGMPSAQTYPAKPIRFIVPFPPGGGNDVMARISATQLAERVGQQIIVDNRSGASGIIGSELTARAAPDGYTILMGHIGTFAFNVSLFPKLPYDPVKDFAAVSLLGLAQNVFVVHPSLPVNNVKEFVALAASKPGQLNVASGGNGASGHIGGELLKLLAKIDMVHVPYKGAAPALTDLMAGNVHMMITNMPAAMPHVQTGRLKAIAVAGLKRSPLVPNLPTLIESGIAGYEFTGWFGVVAPAATPKDVIARLNDDISKILQTPELRDRYASYGVDVAGGTPQRFAAHIQSEVTRWTKIIKEAGIKAD